MNPANYVSKALADLVATMRQTVGGRKTTLFRLACCAGRLVKEGLDIREAERALIEAAISTGLSSRDAASQVRSGLRKGAKDPALRVGLPPLPLVPGVKSDPSYPPLPELLDLWRRARPVTFGFAACEYLKARGLNPWDVELFDLFRILPDGALPGWAACAGRDWRQTGHILIVRLYDAKGVVRSVRARAVHPECSPKELSPQGFSARGLILADLQGAQLLAGKSPKGWPPRVVLVEGVPDFATWATRFSDADEDAPAVFGVMSGSWSEEIASRIPDGAHVALRIHDDEAGKRYEAEIIRTLAKRCRVFVRERAGA